MINLGFSCLLSWILTSIAPMSNPTDFKAETQASTISSQLVGLLKRS
jgi:hypothetical protein